MAEILAALDYYSSFTRQDWLASDLTRMQRTAKSRTQDPRIPARRAFDAAQPIVTVLVGTEEEAFHVHWPVLLASSAFFRARLKPEWSRQESESIRLPDFDSRSFNLYVNWLYTRGIPHVNVITESCSTRSDEWLLLAETYVLGEALVDTAFQASVLEVLRYMGDATSERESFWSVASEIIAVVYEGTPAGSPARDYLLELFLRHARGEMSEELKDGLELPEEFLSAVEEAKLRLAIDKTWHQR